MPDELSKRLDRVRHALGATRSEDLGSLRVTVLGGPRVSGVAIDFNQGRTPTDLEYLAFGLIANIASVKDHLKAWCLRHSQAFEGDELINSNRAAALVHDLWNSDKHAVLDRPRSGVRPRLGDIRQVMVLSAGTAMGSGALFTLDPTTGYSSTQTTGTGSASLVIDAQVLDELGALLGWLQEICSEAIEAWEATAKRAGLANP